jgi:hypothetical protein
MPKYGAAAARGQEADSRSPLCSPASILWGRSGAGVERDGEEGKGPRSVRLELSVDEWREFQGYVRRHYGNVERFFTEKALEMIALGRERAGQRPS